MGMSSHVVGFVPVDEQYEKMKKVYDTCVEAGVDVPSEVEKFFGYSPPENEGMSVDIDKFVKETSNFDGCDHISVDVETMLREFPNVKIIRFSNCY